MTPPSATYRLQLHAGFTFADAAAVVPYLAALGISHLYLSPILKARAGSTHGYDVVDPTTVDPKLGGEPGFRALAAAARAAGMGILVDIVPNHMATGAENPWWQDVLAQGRGSRHARVFDIDWDAGKLLLPVLDRPYGEALAAGAIALATDADGVRVTHHDGVYPIAPADHAEVLSEGIAAYDATTPDGRARLHALLERQHYRLAWWRMAGDAVNWRRFFDIGDLVGVRVEDEAVFAATHATLLRLHADGLIDGFRADHVDGLADPGGYCRRLRHRMRPGAVLLVEKILARDEALDPSWETDGTTGYDFMEEVSAVLHDPEGETPLTASWGDATERPTAFAAEETAARREITDRAFAGQLEAAAAAFRDLAAADPATRDTTLPAIRRCLRALLAHFPVYRTYAAPAGAGPGDRGVLARAVIGAERDIVRADRPTLQFLRAWLAAEAATGRLEELRHRAVVRFEQLTAPIAAKAVEDTAFYRYGRLLSRNDVGFDPGCFAAAVVDFHAAQRARPAGAMVATATHDHKRGEDVRARLAVLSECPGAWRAAIARWMPDTAAPSAGDALMLCQTIVGAWPADLDPGDAAGCSRFVERIARWQVKAMREAKLATDWSDPDAAYEAAARAHLDGLFANDAARLSLAAFAMRIAPAGAVNGLAQLLLRLTVPGVPDTYQGTEHWDTSLVDPDNRGAVDFTARVAALTAAASPTRLVPSWRDGRIKQAILARALAYRRTHHAVFATGTYEPIAAIGQRAAHVVAFARAIRPVGRDETRSLAVTVVPRLPLRLLGDAPGIVPPRAAWGETALSLPGAGEVRDVLRDRVVGVGGSRVAVSDLLAELPVALLAVGPA
ncbi:MAG: malto-oligosyltrehalose synthase [Alphaproteobacteria bacterium]